MISFQATFLVGNQSSWEFCQCKDDRIISFLKIIYLPNFSFSANEATNSKQVHLRKVKSWSYLLKSHKRNRKCYANKDGYAFTLQKKVNKMLQAEYKWQNKALSRECGILVGVLSKCSLSEKLRVITGDEILERFCCRQHQRSCREQECGDWLIFVDRQQDTFRAMCLGQRIRGNFSKGTDGCKTTNSYSLAGARRFSASIYSLGNVSCPTSMATLM